MVVFLGQHPVSECPQIAKLIEQLREHGNVVFVVTVQFLFELFPQFRRLQVKSSQFQNLKKLYLEREKLVSIYPRVELA